jgi:hypothetical protein
LKPSSVRARICADPTSLALLVVPYDSLAGDEPSFEGFADLFLDVRSSAGVARLAVLFLILAFLSTFLGFLISAAIYYILMRTLVRPTNTDFYMACVISYTSVVSVVELLIWILVVGFLASLYGLYLAFVGIREMHETTIG